MNLFRKQSLLKKRKQRISLSPKSQRFSLIKRKKNKNILKLKRLKLPHRCLKTSLVLTNLLQKKKSPCLMIFNRLWIAPLQRNLPQNFSRRSILSNSRSSQKQRRVLRFNQSLRTQFQALSPLLWMPFHPR